MANYIVLKMDLNDKWWDRWFVVGGLSICKSMPLLWCGLTLFFLLVARHNK